jgi:hypothetical protein
MVEAQHPRLVDEQLLKLDQSLLDPARLTEPIGEVAARDEGVGVVGAQHSRLIDEQLLELAHGFLDPARLTKPIGEIAAHREGIGMVGAQDPRLGGLRLDGRRGLDRLAVNEGNAETLTKTQFKTWLIWTDCATAAVSIAGAAPSRVRGAGPGLVIGTVVAAVAVPFGLVVATLSSAA